jgi:hypothetical protein
VLQAETWSLSGGVHHWLKRRSTREERKPVTRNDDDDNNNNNNNNDNNTVPENSPKRYKNPLSVQLSRRQPGLRLFSKPEKTTEFRGPKLGRIVLGEIQVVSPCGL